MIEPVLCEKCGTDHDGHPDETFGANLSCLRARAVNLGATELVEQADDLRRNVDGRRDEQIRHYFNPEDLP